MMPTKTAQNLRDAYMPLMYQAKFAEMIELCDQAYFEADLEGDYITASVALTGLSYAYEVNGDYEQCISYAHRALEAAEASKDKRTLCDALCEVAGSEAQILGRIDASIERFTQALALAEDAEYTLGLAKALHGLGNMHRLRRQMPKALARLQEALKYGKGAGDNHQLTMIHNTLANYYLGNDQPHKALEEYEHALKCCRVNGDRLNETTLLANMGLANTQRLGLDAYRTAFQYFDRL
jgi:tetratricopeptide (TPR) repeat protein